MEQFSFKNFENVRLKATYNMKIGDYSFEPGETLAIFDKVQIAGLNDVVSRHTANGGFDNRAHVFWETTQEQRLTFSQGIFNKVEFALLANAKIISIGDGDNIEITKREALESNENKQVVLSETPSNAPFVYKADDGTKLTYTIDGKIITIGSTFTSVIVDYSYDYNKGAKVYNLGSKYFNGYLELEGTTRVKDDVTGQVVTGLIKIPRLRLMSDLSIRLGAQASPVVANFTAVGVPVGSRGNTYISEFYLLNDDINSDL